MPKPLSIVTTAIAVCACAALVYAQEVAPTERIAAASTATGENRSADAASGEKPSTTSPTKRGDPPSPATLASPEEPAATPKPKSSFFGWLFGSRKKPAATPTPSTGSTPAPASHRGTHKPSGTPAAEAQHSAGGGVSTTSKPGKATPTPKPTPAPKPTPTARTNEKPIHGQKPAKQPETTPKPEKPGTTPMPEKPGTTPKPDKAAPVTPPPVPPTATPPGRKGSKTKPSTPAANASNAPSEPGADADPEAKEKFRFEAARAKAEEDPHVKSLKAKADEATTDAESRAALRAYNKALFEKTKKIDSGVSEWADRMETAILKRLGD
jgi:hypothetical protein